MLAAVKERETLSCLVVRASMLKAKPLSDLLSQVVSPDVDHAMYVAALVMGHEKTNSTFLSLFTKSGSLLAQASASHDSRRSRVIAALAASIWAASDDETGQVANTRKATDYMTVQLQVSPTVPTKNLWREREREREKTRSIV